MCSPFANPFSPLPPRSVSFVRVRPIQKTDHTSQRKQIFRTANAPRTAPDATETLVAQALLDLENNVPDLKAELRPLQISAAREVDVKGGKKAIVVFVPVPQLKAFHKIQGRLTREVSLSSVLSPHPRTQRRLNETPPCSSRRSSRTVTSSSSASAA